jgi:hypothetical protein
MQTAVSEEGLGVEHEVITLILRRQHQGAAPAFSGVDPYPNIIQIWKSRSIVRFDGGSETNIVKQLLIGPRTASLIPTPESMRTDPHARANISLGAATANREPSVHYPHAVVVGGPPLPHPALRA